MQERVVQKDQQLQAHVQHVLQEHTTQQLGLHVKYVQKVNIVLEEMPMNIAQQELIEHQQVEQHYHHVQIVEVVISVPEDLQEVHVHLNILIQQLQNQQQELNVEFQKIVRQIHVQKMDAHVQQLQVENIQFLLHMIVQHLHVVIQDVHVLILQVDNIINAILLLMHVLKHVEIAFINLQHPIAVLKRKIVQHLHA